MARKVAYIVTHPIQYQAPLLKRIAADPEIELLVIFVSDISVAAYSDPGFGCKIEWDVPLLDGYRHVFLKALWGRRKLSFMLPTVTGLKGILSNFCPDLIWVHGWVHWTLIQAINYGSSHGIPVAIRGEIGSHAEDVHGIKRQIKDRFLKWLLARVDYYLAIGTANADYYRSRGIPDERIFMMPYAVDNDYFSTQTSKARESVTAVREKLEFESGRSIILYAGKLSARKRPSLLLEAYRRLRDERGHDQSLPYLVYVGDGEELDALKARVQEVQLTDVRFSGFINQRALPSYYAMSDIFVLPADKEPWGLAVNEAMAASLPVIVSDQVGCAVDIVKPGINGYQFRAADEDGLLDALRRVGSPAEMKRLGDSSRKIISGWSYQQDIEGLKALLEKIQ